MIGNNSHINLSIINIDIVRRTIVCLLLGLLTTSFVLENSLAFEGDLTEIVENSEKEAEAKEKKLLLFAFDFYTSEIIGLSKSKLNGNRIFIPNGIYLDITTPPPELG